MTLRPRPALLAAALLVASPAALAADAVPLEVRVTGFRGTVGQAIVEVYADRESWLKQGAGVVRQVVAIPGGALTMQLSLPPGSYAVSVIHDENKNGELDFRWLPPGPAEGSGVSNDAPATLGPPSFTDSRFVLPAEGRTLAITLRY